MVQLYHKMAISYNVPNFGSTLSGVNAASPTPNYNATSNILNASSNPNFAFLNPNTVGQNFTQDYQSAESGYAPFPGAGTQKAIHQLQDLYNTVPSQYDVSGTLGKLDTARQASLTTGQQASNTAAAKFSQAAPGQYAGAGASVLQAQSLLPYMTQDTQAAASEGQYADTARQSALTTSASIANNIAQLQQGYTNSLASYNSNKAQFGLNYATGEVGLQNSAAQSSIQDQLSLTASQAQLAEQAREANLSASLQSQSQQIGANETATQQQMAAIQNILGMQAPSASYETGMGGNIISGQASYNALQQYNQNKANAVGQLAKIA